MLTDTEMLAILNELKTVANRWDPAAVFVGVGTAVVDKGPETVIGDITACTGAMATRQAVTTWGAAQKLPTGIWCIDSPVMTFVPASSAESQSIAVVYWATLAVAGALRGFKVVAPPYNAIDEFHPYEFVLRLCIDPNGTTDVTVVIPS